MADAPGAGAATWAGECHAGDECVTGNNKEEKEHEIVLMSSVHGGGDVSGGWEGREGGRGRLIRRVGTLVRRRLPSLSSSWRACTRIMIKLNECVNERHGVGKTTHTEGVRK